MRNKKEAINPKEMLIIFTNNNRDLQKVKTNKIIIINEHLLLNKE